MVLLMTLHPIQKLEPPVFAQSAKMDYTGGIPGACGAIDDARLPAREPPVSFAFIGGGSAIIRTALYFTALHGSKYSATFRAFRQKLQEAAKPVTAALIATGRKLLSVLNIMIADGTSFQEAQPGRIQLPANPGRFTLPPDSNSQHMFARRIDIYFI